MRSSIVPPTSTKQPKGPVRNDFTGIARKTPGATGCTFAVAECVLRFSVVDGTRPRSLQSPSTHPGTSCCSASYAAPATSPGQIGTCPASSGAEPINHDEHSHPSLHNHHDRDVDLRMAWNHLLHAVQHRSGASSIDCESCGVARSRSRARPSRLPPPGKARPLHRLLGGTARSRRP